MIFKDAKTPNDYIEVTIRGEAHGDLIAVEIQEDGASLVYLTKKEAVKLSKHLAILADLLTD